MLVNLSDYKVAKEFISDCKVVLQVIDLSIRGLRPFSKYVPVKAVLASLTESKGILEAHMTKAHKIVKGK